MATGGELVEPSLGLAIASGFIAQMIDGAMGMAYGVSATTFLLTCGIPPAAASASVHTAEVFTTLVSGLSHLRFGNVRWALVRKLAIPGVLGGILGAFLLSSIPGETIKPYVAGYLLIMGVMILLRASKGVRAREVKTWLLPLGLVGGFFDALGGGGWGPIVTSTLIARGSLPRFAIGSVNLTEFFVTVAEAATFGTLIGLEHWRIILGLVIGGVMAAPFAAFLCKKLPTRALMLAVGAAIVVLQIRTLYQALG